MQKRSNQYLARRRERSKIIGAARTFARWDRERDREREDRC